VPRKTRPHQAPRHVPLDARLTEAIRRLGLEPAPEQVDALLRYLELLQLWARRINLTTILDPEAIIDRHFCDSLALWAALKALEPNRPCPPDQGHLLDVGAGAGFPGVPLKIMAPSIGLTLLEPRQKRAAFLQVLIATIGCAQCQVIPLRLADLASVATGRFDWIVARGVGRPDELVKESARYLAAGGCLALYVSRQQSVRTPSQPSGFEATDYRYVLPFSSIKHRLLLLRQKQ
jgi:16S rRNA (guanine527-N7)-methyltransferase